MCYDIDMWNCMTTWKSFLNDANKVSLHFRLKTYIQHMIMDKIYFPTLGNIEAFLCDEILGRDMSVFESEE